MKKTIFVFLSLALSACSSLTTLEPVQQSATMVVEEQEMPTLQPTIEVRADLPDLGPAPELNNQVWLNTPHPLRLADLRGNVILLDMWTFG